MAALSLQEGALLGKFLLQKFIASLNHRMTLNLKSPN